MSDEKKAFAEVRYSASARAKQLFVAERYLTEEPASSALGESTTLEQIASIINAAVEAGERQVRAQMAEPFKVWFDDFLARGGVVDAAQAELLRACGLPIPSGKTDLSSLDDAELIDEVQRRGYMIGGIAIPPLGRPMPGSALPTPSWRRVEGGVPVRRCRSTTIPQCTNSSMPGSSLCWQHGGDMVQDLQQVPPTPPNRMIGLAERLGIDLAPGPDETVLAQVEGGEVRHVVRIQNIDRDALESARAELADRAIALTGFTPTPRMRDVARRFIAAYSGGPGGGNVSASHLANLLRQFEGLG